MHSYYLLMNIFLSFCENNEKERNMSVGSLINSLPTAFSLTVSDEWVHVSIISGDFCSDAIAPWLTLELATLSIF